VSYLGRTLAAADANGYLDAAHRLAHLSTSQLISEGAKICAYTHGGRLSHAMDAISKDRSVPVPAALIAAVIHLGAVTRRRATVELVGCTAWSVSPRYPQCTGHRVAVSPVRPDTDADRARVKPFGVYGQDCAENPQLHYAREGRRWCRPRRCSQSSLGRASVLAGERLDTCRNASSRTCCSNRGCQW
jgi:hypothetical protein